MESLPKETTEENKAITSKNQGLDKSSELKEDNAKHNTVYNYVEAKSLYTYEEAKKLGNQPWLIDKFKASPAYKEILDFIYAIQHQLRGMKKVQCLQQQMNAYFNSNNYLKD